MIRKDDLNPPKAKRVLIIDDDASLTQMLKSFLEEHGPFEVITENASPNTLPIAREFQPDLIILDIVMPELGGGEVCEQLQQDEKTKDIPIVFMTSIVRPDEADAGSGVIGGRSYLAKPIQFETLVDFVDEHAR